MSEDMEFLPRNEILSLEECGKLVKAFVDLGVTRVRITGGEPLVRKNAIELFQEIGQLEHLKELTITTNGSQLAEMAASLKSAGVDRINISLDSLDPERFRKITRVGDIHKVLAGITAAKKAGFAKVRLNAVIMRNFNDDEVLALTQFAIDQGCDIAFIEEMPLGDVDHARANSYVSSNEILSTLRNQLNLVESAETSSGPARYWRVADTQTRVGLISPHSHNFCESCNRVRITCKGELYLCLGQEDKVDLMPFLRSTSTDNTALKQAIIEAMKIKPKGHDFDLKRAQPAVVRFMSMTGG